MRARPERGGLPLALALALFVMPRISQALPDGAWVIAIGQNQGDADEVTLRFAERDADQFVEALSEVGGLDPTRVVRLLGTDADTVRRALDHVATQMRAAGEGGALLVFYSGHADATALHLGGSHLPMSELTRRVEEAPGALRLLVIDACRSGSASRVKGMSPREEFKVAVEDRVEAEGLAIITSSTAGEDSQESDSLRGSFFSHHLING
ncbi:MAG: caspase family protein, partial [Myxococcales bacterium]|nr:caspase family protein [Myxococcales bacterium]